jgi:FkbM family methyltransferase
MSTEQAGRPWLLGISAVPSLESTQNSLRERYAFLQRGLPQRLAILGAGGEGRRLAQICSEQGIEVAGIFDNDAGKRGLPVGRHRVMPSDAIGSLNRNVPVVIASHRVLGATLSLSAMGFAVAPFALLQVLAPETFAPHMFYQGLLEDISSQHGRYAELAQMLADEQSLDVLDRVLGYRLSMDAAVLAPVIDWDLYGFSGLLRFADDEVYVDGGAFDGDSVRMFVDRVAGRYQRVLAFEPDPRTFERLALNLKAFPNAEPYNYGLHREKGVLAFNDDGSRGAVIQDDGECRINVVALDEVLAGDRASFIKMNIEGAERAALLGTAATIARWRPKLAISVYHRPDDLWAIPKLIRELCADYRLYLRQHDGGIIETVLYAIP